MTRVEGSRFGSRLRCTSDAKVEEEVGVAENGGRLLPGRLSDRRGALRGGSRKNQARSPESSRSGGLGLTGGDQPRYLNPGGTGKRRGNVKSRRRTAWCHSHGPPLPCAATKHVVGSISRDVARRVLGFEVGWALGG